MTTFDWLATPARKTQKEAALLGWQRELSLHAGMLARLGYSKKQAEARLTKNLAWEYERVGGAKPAKQLASLVTEAFAKASSTKGAGKKKR